MGFPGDGAGRLKLETETFPAQMKMLEPAEKSNQKRGSEALSKR